MTTTFKSILSLAFGATLLAGTAGVATIGQAILAATPAQAAGLGPVTGTAPVGAPKPRIDRRAEKPVAIRDQRNNGRAEMRAYRGHRFNYSSRYSNRESNQRRFGSRRR
jgi:hypothetical protein